VPAARINWHFGLAFSGLSHGLEAMGMEGIFSAAMSASPMINKDGPSAVHEQGSADMVPPGPVVEGKRSPARND